MAFNLAESNHNTTGVEKLNSFRESFNCLANWLTDARTLASPAIVILMVGNKTDLEEEREVTFLEASRLVTESSACCKLIIISFSATI